jgi:hypothetical protein
LPVVGERPQMGTVIIQGDYTENTGLGEGHQIPSGRKAA